MTLEGEIFAAMRESVRQALSEAAKEEIDKLMHRFECEMGKVKRETIAKIIENIDITTNNNPMCEGYTIQVNIKR